MSLWLESWHTDLIWLCCYEIGHLLQQKIFSEDICRARCNRSYYIVYVPCIYACMCACQCVCSVHRSICVCVNLCVFMCVCGLCVLKSENNKQRSQTVILHKRPVSFFSLSLPVIKCYSVALQATSHGLSHRNQRPGDGVYVCVRVLLVRDGHLSHNNVPHIQEDQQAPHLSILPFLSPHSLSFYFSLRLPKSIIDWEKNISPSTSLHPQPLSSSLIHPSIHPPIFHIFLPFFYPKCVCCFCALCVCICICLSVCVCRRGRDSDDDDCACIKQRLAWEGWMCDNTVWLFPDSLTMSEAVKEEMDAASHLQAHYGEHF